MSGNVTVSRADLSMVLRDWGKDYAPAAMQLAYRRIMAAMDAPPEPAPAPTCAMCGGSGMCEQPKSDPYPCPVCGRNMPLECIECSAPATNGLYCAEHAPEVKR